MNLFWSLLYVYLLIYSVSNFVSSENRGTHEDEQTQTFIIRVQNDLKPSVYSDLKHWYSSTLKTLTTHKLEEEQSSKKEFLHVYKTVFHGFSTKLTQQQANEIKNRHGVLGVYPDRVRQIQTTRSPGFLGLGQQNTLLNRRDILSVSDYGSNVVIGVFDTGIWPELRSFNDAGMDPVPAHWKGECVEAQGFSKSLCNKKLVGARFFIDGYIASRRGGHGDTAEFRSPRDSEGHGTHTASTAAGRQVLNASMLGKFANGVAVGIAPKARIAVYKICWPKGCFDSDILAAFDKAVEDGVNVISLSVGGSTVPYESDPIAMGAFGAMEKGVFVSAAAGNEGPGTLSVNNIAPWITTVGAGSIDRKFPADLILQNGVVIRGSSLYDGTGTGTDTFFPIVYAGNLSGGGNSNGTYPKRTGGYSAAICMPNSLDPELVRGKIVVCDRGGHPRVAKGAVVKEAGGVGVVVANVSPEGEGLVSDSHIIPGLGITESGSYKVHEYLATSVNPSARLAFYGTQMGIKPAPVVAGFSSRGPNMESIYVIKPDVIAPGVDILAAWPPDASPTSIPSDNRRTEFNILSGTSMSCPHVSGLAALLKGAHQDWSPARIRSALMTTAYMLDNTKKVLLNENNFNLSSVWDMGSGHVDPGKAIDPGLVYDLTVDDYLDFLCASNYTRRSIRSIARRAVNCTKVGLKAWDLNYPSISVAFEQSGSSNFMIEVRRTATHVSDGSSVYTAKIENPIGAFVTVDPPKLEFNKKEEKQSYVVKISGNNTEPVPPGNTKSEFGRLTWTDGKHIVSMPLVVTWQQPY